MNRAGNIIFVSILCTAWCAAGVQFRVEPIFPPLPEHVSGRVLVLVKMASAEAGDHPSLSTFDYLLGVDAKDLKPGDSINVNDEGTCYPPITGELPKGNYVAFALL